jgi:hypothetical protein
MLWVRSRGRGGEGGARPAQPQRLPAMLAQADASELPLDEAEHEQAPQFLFR